MGRVVVVGQVARDLVLRVPDVPDAGGSVDVRERAELLGGKGANQAVGLRRLGLDVTAVGVVGDDGPGREVFAQAEADGIDVGPVVRRGTTALLVDVVADGGVRRLLEHVPEDQLLTAADVRAAADAVRGADLVLVQLQQPGPAVLEALRVAGEAGVRVVADGAPEDDDVRDVLLRSAHALRADAAEAELLLDRSLDDVDAVLDAARELQADGPAVVALAAGTDANVVVWDGGHVVMPLLDGPVEDPTGGGDAFVAGLAAGLVLGEDVETSSWWASAAAALTVATAGGRPTYTLDEVRDRAAAARP